MPSGGSRNRSGPAADPKSARSQRRDLFHNQLPAEGYDGEVPRFPLPSSPIEGRDEREQELWSWAWSTPQAAAWARESWRWQSVAMWVRVSALCESPEAQAADKGSLHRFADQIGLTPAGLKENGWEIVRDDLQEKRAEKSEVATSDSGKLSARERRLKAVADAQ